LKYGEWGSMTLNVGGCLYTTSQSTLQRYPDSMLGIHVPRGLPHHTRRSGTLPQFCRYTVGPNFLRTSELTLPCDITEMDLLHFYQIKPLMQKLSMYSNLVAVVITKLTITTKVRSLLERVSNSFTKWIKHMMDSSDFQVCLLRVHLLDYISKQGFRNTRVHQMSERANENTVEHHWTFCRLARKVDD
uniref:Potassium channel tetramerization domain containing 6a n=1 Tax=Salmo trutta TaxID=8032 RepID=A0A673W439_SALTR